jgi:flagellar basal-body rod protein FlgG
MNGVLFIGATGLRAQQAAVDTVANNIANINTPAFKRSAVAFSELVSQGLTVASVDAARALTLDAPQGVMVASSPKNFEPGLLRKTDSPADIAIRGPGFIELMSPGGQTLLWRGSAMRVNPDGFLAAANGMQLKASISVPRDATNVQIAQNGVVLAVLPGATRAEQIGQIELVSVGDTRALTAVGDGMYRVDDPLTDVVRGLPGEGTLGLIQQGYSEASNVNLADEMVGMVLMQRAYAANARVVQVADEMMQTVNQMRR